MVRKFIIPLVGLFLGVIGLSGAVRAQENPGYCEGHARADGVDANVQGVVGNAQAPEYAFNGRQEICFDMHWGPRQMRSNNTLIIENDSDTELVIGFLDLERIPWPQRYADSSIPMIEVFGRNVTLFEPRLSGAINTIVFHGDGHKIIGGSITGLGNREGSVCVSADGDNFRAEGTVFQNCERSLKLRGKKHRLKNIKIEYDYASRLPQIRNYNLRDPVDLWRLGTAYAGWYRQYYDATDIAVQAEGYGHRLDGVTLEGFHGTGIHLSGTDHEMENMVVRGAAFPFELRIFREILQRIVGHPAYLATNGIVIDQGSRIALTGSEVAENHTGISIVNSDGVFVGPEAVAEYESAGNRLQRNGYAVHAAHSQRVFVMHNLFAENIPWNADAWGLFSFWPELSNIFRQSDNRTIYLEPEESRMSEGIFRFRVPVQSGTIELDFMEGIHPAEERSFPFQDCAFAGAGLGEDETALVECRVEMNPERMEKDYKAILHSPEHGSSAPILVRWKGSTVPPLSIPESSTGSMEGVPESAGISVSPKTSEVSEVVSSADSSRGGASCAFHPGAGQEGLEGFDILFCTILLLLGFRLTRASAVSKNPGPTARF